MPVSEESDRQVPMARQDWKLFARFGQVKGLADPAKVSRLAQLQRQRHHAICILEVEVTHY